MSTGTSTAITINPTEVDSWARSLKGLGPAVTVAGMQVREAAGLDLPPEGHAVMSGTAAAAATLAQAGGVLSSASSAPAGIAQAARAADSGSAAPVDWRAKGLAGGVTVLNFLGEGKSDKKSIATALSRLAQQGVPGTGGSVIRAFNELRDWHKAGGDAYERLLATSGSKYSHMVRATLLARGDGAGKSAFNALLRSGSAKEFGGLAKVAKRGAPLLALGADGYTFGTSTARAFKDPSADNVLSSVGGFLHFAGDGSGMAAGGSALFGQAEIAIPAATVAVVAHGAGYLVDGVNFAGKTLGFWKGHGSGHAAPEDPRLSRPYSMWDPFGRTSFAGRTAGGL